MPSILLRMLALAIAVCGLGAVAAGCLTRPVVSHDPSTNTTFTTAVSNAAIDKVDLLFMIDNSSSMGDKQTLLAQAVPDLLSRLVSPNCVDVNGNPFSPNVTADASGACTMGTPEFPPVHDMHIGVVSSSLGARGGSYYCDPAAMNPANTTLPAHNDDRGELINRGGATEQVIPDATPDNFLAWLPNVTANTGKPAPPVTALTAVGDANTPGTLIGDFTQMVTGVNEHGCGFEAMNDAWYRFLVEPDPYDSIAVTNGLATLTGVDATILQQRHDFLRPDSLVAVIVVTDEWADETADPLSVGGQDWFYENGNPTTGTNAFPGSSTGYSPEGTIECAQPVTPGSGATTGPYGASCQSCALTTVQSSSTFATRCPAVGMGSRGYLDATNDEPNIRFFQTKRRFGIDTTFPTSRYVRGLTRTTVAGSANEHDQSGTYVGDQDAQANCTNPLFAASLPTSPTDELCKLPVGTRTPDRIFYAAITGVPHQLLQVDPTDPNSPQKDTLAEADWLKITGADPEHYDFTGADFHMIESELPRVAANLPPGVVNASSCPPGSPDGCDPINGREWDTTANGTNGASDMQYACIFQLPAPKDCTQPQYTNACDCAPMPAIPGSNKTPLCQMSATGTYTNTQINGKAYPGVQHATIAHALSPPGKSAQGILSSLCPIHVTPVGGTDDPLYGYRPAATAIVNRLKVALNNQCVPQALVPQPDGSVPCLLLVTLPADGTNTCKNPGTACSSRPGLSVVPDAAVLNTFCDAQEATFDASGGAASGAIDPATQPVCELNQLTPAANPADFDANGSCSGAPDSGWCYVDAATAPNAAKGCPHTILFTAGEPPTGTVVNLQCIEQSVSVVDGG